MGRKSRRRKSLAAAQRQIAKPAKKPLTSADLMRMFRSRACGIFLFFWLAFGVTMNLGDLRAYNLQQMGVDAIVSHQTFTLGHGKNPLLQPGGDTFQFAV